MADYSKYSIYAETIQRDGFLQSFNHTVNVLPDATDYEVVIDRRHHNRPDLFAMDNYGAPALWWIIPMLNNFSDLVFDFSEGKVIKIMTQKRFHTFK